MYTIYSVYIIYNIYTVYGCGILKTQDAHILEHAL